MPRIILDGCDTTKIIRQISIHVKVDFDRNFYRNYSLRADEKLNQLENELGEVLKKYFEDYSSDKLSNHEYNLRMNNF